NGNARHSSGNQEIREKLLCGICVHLLKGLGNRSESLLGKKPDLSCLSAIYEFDPNFEITVRGLDYPDQVFVGLERVWNRALGLIADLVEPSRETTVYDNRKLFRQIRCIWTT